MYKRQLIWFPFVECLQDLHYTGYGVWNAGMTYTTLVRIYACRTYTTLVVVCEMPAGPTQHWLPFVECLQDLHYNGYSLQNACRTYTTMVTVCGMPGVPEMPGVCC